ncbi:coiled-coil domain-containing protein 14 [Spea bombifrons]|uniref:coiled-coil domain-containing protein 14 n=1 Tax=Spea bombifrons TaxID=233779 RepID=UPI0023496CBF|nr:coiled-coil domain-containing protein 14 [Spea bombifrons]
MARAGGRAGKVVSSARLAGPARLSTAKKRLTTRKVSAASVDSGYSLYSTDSEDQVQVINKGLDRCAALLQDILQNDVKDNTRQNPAHRTAFPRGGARPPAAKVKKNLTKKTTTASHVHKEIVSVKQCVPPARHNSEVKPTGSCGPPRVPSPHSPVAQPALCEHVQTRMSRLKLDQGPDSVTLYNYRLPCSTPALSPQHTSNPQGCGHNGYHQVLPQGGAAVFPSSLATTGPVPPAVCYVTAPGQHGSPVPAGCPQTYQANTLPNLSDTQIRESDLLQCVAAHLAQLQHSATIRRDIQKPAYAADPTSERDEPAKDTDELSSEEDNHIALNVAPGQDISCQTSFDKSFKPKKSSPEKKIKTVKYLLGEIKSLVAEQDDGDAFRLIAELERSLSLLPAVVGSTNVHAEIALALQPLRSENAQLRRRLRILNQQLRDCEKHSRSDFEVTSLQSMNVTLQHQLAESQKSLESLQSKNEELLKIIDTQRAENKTFAQIIQEKEREVLGVHQQNEIAATRAKIDLEEALGKMKGVQFKLESAEKENQILEITLRQRDTEVSRLRELTRTLQGSMAKLLCDLRKDSGKTKSGNTLTQSLLDSYEKQLQEDPCPASTSVISYLKQLETDQVLPSTEPIFAAKPSPCDIAAKSSKRCAALALPASKAPDHARQNTNSFRPPSTRRPETHRSDAGSGSCMSLYDEYKPDETSYLPLASTPQKATVVKDQMRMCTPPRAGPGARDYETSCTYTKPLGFEVAGDLETARDFKLSLQNFSQNLERSVRADEANSKTEPLKKAVAGRPSAVHPPGTGLEDRHPDHSMYELLSAKSDWTVTTFSTFTSHDEQDFRTGLAALDANIAKLQRTLQAGAAKK